MIIRALTTVATMVACLALVACGGGGSATIEGTVTVEGASEAGATVALDAVEEGEDPTVSAADAEDVEPLAESATDDGGKYSFEDLEPGDYLVFTDVAGCRILSLAEVAADATQTIDLDIPANYTPVGPLSLLPSGDILAC